MQYNYKESTKKKIAFFVKQGLDSFLGDIINELSDICETRKIIVTDYTQIDKGMEWADICWFEWCDELVAYGSKLNMAKDKKIICRLHSYEAFNDYPSKVEFENVDKIIFVAEHIKNFVANNYKLAKEKIIVIPNGIDCKKWTFSQRKQGFNIAYVGYINYKKGPMLLLHTFKAIYDMNNRYKLFIAGQFQDDRDVLYFNQMIKEFGIENNVIYEGWKNNLDKWLEDKNYILCTSILESQNMCVMQAMAKGIKPIIHNFVGAKEIYPKALIWNTIGECVEMISSIDYDSKEFSDFVKQKYSLDKQIAAIKETLNEVINSFDIIEYVRNILEGRKKCSPFNLKDLTLLITCFNKAEMLKTDIEKGLKLPKQNKLIVDDCSTKETEYILYIKNNIEALNVLKIVEHEKNRGLAGSRKTGFENINTDYTMVLDDDDMILCIDNNKFIDKFNRLNNDSVMLIPRYIINLYEDGTFNIGYDRICFDEQPGRNVLYDISITSEVKALLAGSISRTKDLLAYDPVDTFRVSEDFVTLIRTFANNLDKKIIVSEDLVHIRRIDKNSLSKTLTENKLALGLIAQSIGCYYCVKNNIFTFEKAFEYMRQRAALLQQLYGFGIDFEEEYIAYLNSELKEDILIKYFRNLQINCENSLDELAEEINDFKKILVKNTNIIIDNKLPLVSVIIPTYNGKKYISETIESILSQDYPNIELIISDDCSTDGTEDIVKEYLIDKRIKYIRNEQNMGITFNCINSFYNHTSGKYVKLLDHDDYLIDNSYISKAVELFNENDNISLVFAKCKNLNMDSGKLIPINLENDRFTSGLEYFLNYEKSNKYGHITSVVTAIFDREKLTRVNCFKDKTDYKDLFLHLNSMLVGDIGFINSYCGVYRVDKASRTYNMARAEIGKAASLEHDKLVISELEKLKGYAQTKYNLTDNQAVEWLKFRVMKLFFFRINTLIELQMFDEINITLETIKQNYYNEYLFLKNYFCGISN